MKKALITIGIVILSLLITFITFEALSWYHFGDIPTQVVLIRLIIFFIIVWAVLCGLIILIKNLKK